MPKKRKKEKTTTIRLEPDKNIFNILLKPRFALVKSPVIDELLRESTFHKNIDPHLKQIRLIRQLLNPEKIKMLYTIKHQKPTSIYELAKFLNRDFKAVRQDIKILEKSNFVLIIREKIKNRLCAKPVIQFEKINFSIEI